MDVNHYNTSFKHRNPLKNYILVMGDMVLEELLILHKLYAKEI